MARKKRMPLITCAVRLKKRPSIKSLTAGFALGHFFTSKMAMWSGKTRSGWLAAGVSVKSAAEYCLQNKKADRLVRLIDI